MSGKEKNLIEKITEAKSLSNLQALAARVKTQGSLVADASAHNVYAELYSALRNRAAILSKTGGINLKRKEVKQDFFTFYASCTGQAFLHLRYGGQVDNAKAVASDYMTQLTMNKSSGIDLNSLLPELSKEVLAFCTQHEDAVGKGAAKQLQRAAFNAQKIAGFQQQLVGMKDLPELAHETAENKVKSLLAMYGMHLVTFKSLYPADDLLQDDATLLVCKLQINLCGEYEMHRRMQGLYATRALKEYAKVSPVMQTKYASEAAVWESYAPQVKEAPAAQAATAVADAMARLKVGDSAAAADKAGPANA